MLQIDSLSRVPVYEQIIRQMERLVLTGVLSPGSQMPSVRSLSVELSINPNTIQKAYTELDRRGIARSVPGRGCFVAEGALEALKGSARHRLSELAEIVEELKLAGLSENELVEEIHRLYQAGA